MCQHHGEIVGYVYASKHRERLAYQWAVDVTAYVRPGFHRSGIGRGLYTSLLELLRMQNYYNAFAIAAAKWLQCGSAFEGRL